MMNNPDHQQTSPSARLNEAAERLIALLHQHNLRIVFAESCTAGLIAATLGRTPGISDYLCGSAVVYREATKTAWLGVSAADLSDPAITAVSPQVAEAMAVGVLEKTPEAGLASAVTGYLGPDSAPEMDGIAWIAVAVRDPDDSLRTAIVRRIRLSEVPNRCMRQDDAAAQVLAASADVLESIHKIP